MQHTLWSVGEGIWSLPIVSNHVIMQVIGALLLIWLLPKAVRQRAGDDEIGRLVPRGLGNAIEATCVTFRDAIIRPNLGKYADAFTPFIWSLFFFLLISNLLGMIPLADWTGWIPALAPHGHALLGGTSTGNIWVTGGLAAMVLVMIVVNGLRYNGLDYVKHFFMGPWWIAWFIAILEMVGVFFKCMALAIRLFANMLAGHVMLAVLMGFVAAAFKAGLASGIGIGLVVWVASILLYFLEIFVAFLHAFIFTMLTAVFIGMAVNIHHDDEHGEEHAAAAH
ncbi:MAG: ATP synthase F0 subunit A [Planctomycetota bacterium]|nr:MAG: ATP synthase F0 subunit A [Planctomycetota bacterium]